MAIFVLLVSLICLIVCGIEARLCEFHTEKNKFFSCVSMWEYGNEYINKPTAYLRDLHITRDICQRGHIDKVENCVHYTVSQHCGNIQRYWSGARNKAQYICNHYHEFVSEHKSCRTNTKLLAKYDQCVDENNQRMSRRFEFCESIEQLRVCVGKALKHHCDQKAARFFMNVLDKELSTDMNYRNCRKDDVLHEQTTTEPPRLDNIQTTRIFETFRKLRTSSNNVESNFESVSNGVSNGALTQQARYLYITLYISMMTVLR